MVDAHGYLSDLVSLEYGSALSEAFRTEGPYPVVGSAGIVGWHNDWLLEAPGIVVGRKGTVGHVTWLDKNFWPIDTTFYVVPKRDLHLRWTYYLLQWLPLRALDITTGVPGLNRHDAHRVSVPFVPCGAEQRAVADILDAVDAAILEAEALIAKLTAVRIGLINDLLTRGVNEHGELRGQATLVETEIGRRPKTWRIGPLGQFLAGAQYGTSTGLDLGPGIPVLRMNNIKDGEFDLSDLRYSKLPADEALRLRLDDVLYNRTNSWEHVGKAAIWREENDGPAFASYLVRLVCSETIAPKYLHLWINWLPTQRALRRFATPGVQQVNVNPTNLQRLKIAVPTDIVEQQLLAERVDALRERQVDIKERASKLRALRDGLRDDLLSGRVRVAMAADPAEVAAE